MPKARGFTVPTLFLFLTLIAAFNGCKKENSRKTGKPVIGFAINTLNNPFFVEMKRAAEIAADKQGVEIIIQATEREMDVEKQIQIVENLLQRNVSALCLTPNGSREVVPAILKANRQDVPMIIVDSRVDARALRDAGGWIASFVGSDNVEGGKLAGEFIVSRLAGKGNVAVLEGPAGHETGDSRLKGLREALNREPGIRVVSSQLASFDRSQGYTVFQNILQANRDVQAVFACNDLMALGAVEAIAAAGKTGSIIVVGFDAVDEAREAIRSGKMDATIAQYPGEMGRVAVETATGYLRGQNPPEVIATKIELITKDNVNAHLNGQ